MRAELIELHRRLGRTMVYVTHDQLEAMTMSDRIADHGGRAAAAVRPPRRSIRSPPTASSRASSARPAMNLIDGRLSQDGGRWRFEAPGCRSLDARAPTRKAARPASACGPRT
jgi:multiple sugar transport system ATP-binding protein